MKKYNYLLLSLLVILSCTDSRITDERYIYDYLENSKLIINKQDGNYMAYAEITEGDKLVFVYEYHSETDERIADDGYSDYINFEIDSGLSSFKIEGDDLVMANVTFRKSCFCYFEDTPEKNVAPTGVISGEKITDQRWRINLDVTFYGDEQKSIDGVFVLREN